MQENIMTLYEAILQFWSFWFPLGSFTNELKWIAFVGTMIILIAVFVLPFISIYKSVVSFGRGRSRRRF